MRREKTILKGIKMKKTISFQVLLLLCVLLSSRIAEAVKIEFDEPNSTGSVSMAVSAYAHTNSDSDSWQGTGTLYDNHIGANKSFGAASATATSSIKTTANGAYPKQGEQGIDYSRIFDFCFYQTCEGSPQLDVVIPAGFSSTLDAKATLYWKLLPSSEQEEIGMPVVVNFAFPWSVGSNSFNVTYEMGVYSWEASIGERVFGPYEALTYCSPCGEHETFPETTPEQPLNASAYLGDIIKLSYHIKVDGHTEVSYSPSMFIDHIYGHSIRMGFIISVLEPPVASFIYLPEKPMVGGLIAFGASKSKGDIVDYEWDFDDGDFGHGVQVSHIFQEPKIYDVDLTVTDSYGLTDSSTVKLDLALENGDLLLWRSNLKRQGWPGLTFWNHVGIYRQESNKVIEVRKNQPVSEYPLSDWFYPGITCAKVCRVNTDQATRDAAVNFALDKLGMQYDLFSILTKQKQDGNKASGLDTMWYCSELAWAAYLNASNGQINLDPDEQGLVSPDEIDDSHHTEMRGQHIEDIPVLGPMIEHFWGLGSCPVDFEITDPDGLILNQQGSQIPDALYQEVDTDGDNDLNDFFAIPDPKEGVYLIRVIPEAGASSSDTFTLVVYRGGSTKVLAQDLQIQDIPDFPYIVTTFSSLSADMEIDPETLNLNSQGNWITCYIQFPEAYYIANIDSSTLLLNGEIPPARLFAGDEEDIEQILMVKFDRSDLQKIIQPGNVELIVTGELLDGTPFECRDTIRVIDKGGKK